MKSNVTKSNNNHSQFSSKLSYVKWGMVAMATRGVPQQDDPYLMKVQGVVVTYDMEYIVPIYLLLALCLTSTVYVEFCS